MGNIDLLIAQIERLQVSDDEQLFKTGMFRSQRCHRFLPYLREDNNIFFPASIAFILHRHLQHLDKGQAEKAEKIIGGVKRNYPFYSGHRESYLYNFYQTNPHKHYPNGLILSRFKHFILADDADDTVIISMTLGDLSSERISRVREKLVEFSNLNQKKIKVVGSEYSELPFYGVWFGSGKMPVELEICVICNILYFVFVNKPELNVQDRASLALIKRTIDNNDIVARPYLVSGQYPRTSVILYHITRLCSVIDQPGLYFDIEKLAEIARSQMATATTLERIILSLSLMNLGHSTEPIVWSIEELKKEFRSFLFFQAPMLSGTTNKILNYLKSYPLFQILFRCDAFYYALVLEYEIMKKKYLQMPG